MPIISLQEFMLVVSAVIVISAYHPHFGLKHEAHDIDRVAGMIR